MNLSTWQDWVSWAGIAIPLAALAWAAVSYVLIEKNKEKKNRYDQFFNLMEQIGTENSSNASKFAAISELKEYYEYKDVIIRFCSITKFEGDYSPALYNELDITLKHFGHVGKTPSPLGEGGGEGK